MQLQVRCNQGRDQFGKRQTDEMIKGFCVKKKRGGGGRFEIVIIDENLPSRSVFSSPFTLRFSPFLEL